MKLLPSLALLALAELAVARGEDGGAVLPDVCSAVPESCRAIEATGRKSCSALISSLSIPYITCRKVRSTSTRTQTFIPQPLVVTSTIIPSTTTSTVRVTITQRSTVTRAPTTVRSTVTQTSRTTTTPIIVSTTRETSTTQSTTTLTSTVVSTSVSTAYTAFEDEMTCGDGFFRRRAATPVDELLPKSCSCFLTRTPIDPGPAEVTTTVTMPRTTSTTTTIKGGTNTKVTVKTTLTSISKLPVVTLAPSTYTSIITSVIKSTVTRQMTSLTTITDLTTQITTAVSQTTTTTTSISTEMADPCVNLHYQGSSPEGYYPSIGDSHWELQDGVHNAYDCCRACFNPNRPACALYAVNGPLCKLIMPNVGTTANCVSNWCPNGFHQFYWQLPPDPNSAYTYYQGRCFDWGN